MSSSKQRTFVGCSQREMLFCGLSGRDHEARNVSGLAAGKGKETDSPPEPPDGAHPNNLILAK